MITIDTSPSETINQNRTTEHIFNRFEINVNSTDKILKSTSLKEINPEFLVDVLNIFCRYKDINLEVFNKYSIPIIIDYLKRSHRYYLEKIIPEIGQSISLLLKNYKKGHPLLEILYKFYFNYKVDLQEHFNDEENGIFTYANRLYRAVYFKKDLSFFIYFLQQNSINDYVETHSDTIENLTGVTNILLQYDPPKTNKTSFRVLIDQLKNFEKDLKIHSFIEDKVLVTKLYELEQNLKLEVNN